MFSRRRHRSPRRFGTQHFRIAGHADAAWKHRMATVWVNAGGLPPCSGCPRYRGRHCYHHDGVRVWQTRRLSIQEKVVGGHPRKVWAHQYQVWYWDSDLVMGQPARRETFVERCWLANLNTNMLGCLSMSLCTMQVKSDISQEWWWDLVAGLSVRRYYGSSTSVTQ